MADRRYSLPSRLCSLFSLATHICLNNLHIFFACCSPATEVFFFGVLLRGKQESMWYTRRGGLRHYLHFAWKLMKASVEAFTGFMEASPEDMEAMEASMKACN